MTTPDSEVTQELALGDAFAQLAAKAAADQAAGLPPAPVAAGQFALYVLPDGSAVMATEVADGPLSGPRSVRMPRALISAVTVLASGGSKTAILKALMGARKAIGDG